jgi:hypothetical protein
MKNFKLMVLALSRLCCQPIHFQHRVDIRHDFYASREFEPCRGYTYYSGLFRSIGG